MDINHEIFYFFFHRKPYILIITFQNIRRHFPQVDNLRTHTANTTYVNKN
jgi:hypothetical protein